MAALVLFLGGCGHATAPCPTPTTELDRHREESLAAQREAGRAAEEVRALRERRDRELGRVAEAEAALDSLDRVRGASPASPASPASKDR